MNVPAVTAASTTTLVDVDHVTATGGKIQQMSEPEEDDWDEFESGPFCQHWLSPGDCEATCAGCGHPCDKHNELGCDECDCTEWKDR